MAATNPAQDLLRHLLDSAIVPREDWDALPSWARDRAASASEPRKLVDHLLAQSLLTGYQSLRIRAGKFDGLVLGNYRVLDRLGAGNTGVIFKAENVQTRQLAAVKVLVPSEGNAADALLRFEAERQSLALLHHPHIAAALDLGEITTSDPASPVLYYYAMEYVEGQDLEHLVKQNGPLTEDAGLDVAEQLASALAEAHRHQLVHRDMNPSNVVLTPSGDAKLLDFGRVKHPGYKVSEPCPSVGLLEYAAPEQLKDATSVDARADIYGLGTTLFWCLTGRSPFPRGRDCEQDYRRRLGESPPSAVEVRPELSADVDRLLQRMMALNPAERYADPAAVVQAIRTLRKLPALPASPAFAAADSGFAPGGTRRALVVSDSMQLARACLDVLSEDSVEGEEAYTLEEALESARARPPEVILLDAEMGEGQAVEVLRALRQAPPCPHLKILMLTPSAAPEVVSELLTAGADGYVAMPLDALQLRTRVRTAMQVRDAQTRADFCPRQESAAEPAGAAGRRGKATGVWLNPMRWLFGRRQAKQGVPPTEV